MEYLIDKHIKIFCLNLDDYTRSGEVFDLKELIAFYVVDVLGELAFSRSFEMQIQKDSKKLPPINDHIYLACLMGQLPDFMPFFKAIAPWLPIAWIRRLLTARELLKTMTAACVKNRMNEKLVGRKDLLSCLIKAVDPETGTSLTELDINTEAFAML